MRKYFKIRLYYIILLYINTFYSTEAFLQIAAHIDLVSHIRIPEHASSIWGYTDVKGTEYALLGTAQGLRIFTIEDSAQAKELFFIQCSPSPWRELKTSGEFAYIVTEAEDGLLIVDLRYLPDTVYHSFQKDFKTIHGDSIEIIAAHTIYVDEKNYIYLSGARPHGYGFIILDPSLDPFHPLVLAQNEDQYMHEVFAYRDTLYGAELFHGVFSVWDITDRTSPLRLADYPTGGHFTHSVWLEKNQAVLYTADEVSGAGVEAWNVSNLNAIRRMDHFKIQNDHSDFIIPHNVFHQSDKLYVSYYTEGVRILDTKDPENLIEVAYYDTHQENDHGFHGCWSVYPYFNSGLCIASDIENGLFVLKYDGNQAAYLNAEIVDKSNGSPVFNASLQIQQNQHKLQEFSNLKGRIKSGVPENGDAEIQVYKKGYYPQIRNVVFDKNKPLVLKFELEELPKHNLKIIVRDKLTNAVIQDAKIILFNDDFSFNFSTDPDGESTANDIYENNWTLVVGKWSYKQFALKDFELNANQEIEVKLESGYEDDFILDLGWTSTGNDPKVKWIKGDFTEIPVPSSNFPSKDNLEDLGSACYYTNNFDNSGTEYHLHGELLLFSPPMNLNRYSSVDISYQAWAYGGYTSFKEIYLQNGDTRILLESVPELLTGNFNPKSFIHIDLENIKKDSVHFVFRLYNDSATANMAIQLMGAMDVFKLTGEMVVSTNDYKHNSAFYPNPVVDKFWIENPYDQQKLQFEIYSVYGQMMKTCTSNSGQKSQIDVTNLDSGIYFLKSNKSENIIRFIKI